MSRFIRLAGLTLAGAAALTTTLATADPASAAPTGTTGSIVYLRAHNVYIVRGDGSHARRLTRDGTAARPYLSPSEADNGTIVAARGR